MLCRISYDSSYYSRKLFTYKDKYKNCNDSNNILICGNKYEGQKKEQIDFNIHNFYVTNLSRVIALNKYSKNAKCKNNKLIIAITSAPNYYLQRESFRFSYENYTKYVSFLFFTGLSNRTNENMLLFDEQNQYHDIVIFNYISSYYNSSLLMVLLMKWVYRKCKEYLYLIYHTSDVYFNLKLFLKQYHFANYSFISKIVKKARVIRKRNSRFYIPYKIYNYSHFPDYPSGPFIALSPFAIRIISLFDYNKITNLWIDDVIIGIIFDYAQLKGKNINNICNTYPASHYLPNLDFIKESYIYIHSLPPGSIYYLHNII